MTDIRACVLSPDYKTVWTWYTDGSIWQFYRDTGYERERSARANTLTEFNDFLVSIDIKPLKTRAALSLEQQQKVLDKFLVSYKDEGVTEMF